MSENQQTFDRYARERRLPDSDDAHTQARRSLAKTLIQERSRGKRILDAGCGFGLHTGVCAEVAKEVVGVDFSQEMLALARGNGTGCSNISWQEGDLTKLPLPNDSFDGVFSLSTLYHIPNQETALREMARVLKPGGWALFDLGNRFSLNRLLVPLQDVKVSYVSPGKMREMILKAGFRILECRYFQFLPLYGGWLVPFSGKRSRNFFAKTYKGKTVDERLSSLPLLRRFAFRHLFICTKP